MSAQTRADSKGKWIDSLVPTHTHNLSIRQTKSLPNKKKERRWKEDVDEKKRRGKKNLFCRVRLTKRKSMFIVCESETAACVYCIKTRDEMNADIKE